MEFYILCSIPILVTLYLFFAFFSTTSDSYDDVRGMFEIQLVNDADRIIHNPTVRKRYPRLYEAVYHAANNNNSSWFHLNKSAYIEYNQYLKDNSIK